MTTQLEVKQLLASLSKAIKGDRHFFVAAKTDPNFDPIRTHVDELLRQLTQEAKTQAEKAIAHAQSALNEMENWHAYEAASSDHDSALNTMSKARESFQSDSYFGYLDAQLLAGEAKKKAKSAITAQKTHIKGVIDRLKSQAAQLWEDEGDFGKYEIEKYAPAELEAALKQAREGWKCSEVETYASYKKAQSSLRECLRLGYSAIEKSIDVLEKHELRRDTQSKIWRGICFGTLGGFLATILLAPIIAANLEESILRATEHYTYWVGPMIGAFTGFVVALFRTSEAKEAIRGRYERLEAKLKDKYTPAC